MQFDDDYDFFYGWVWICKYLLKKGEAIWVKMSLFYTVCSCYNLFLNQTKIYLKKQKNLWPMSLYLD